VAYPRYLGADGVERFCETLLAEAGVLLLPGSVYRSELTATPPDRFRIGVGRQAPEPALAAFASWLRVRG
jgi:aspartate/methionine/tyrosine aminotransferase